MLNNKLFASQVTKMVKNEAGGKAYKFTDEHTLASFACVGTFNGTFYTSGDQFLSEVKEVVARLKNNPEFVAKVAIYSRNKTFMKDMPAYLCAVLACWGEHQLFRIVFKRVINNGKMLRNFVQIGRSGQAGKVLNMSSGCVRKAIQEWFDNKSPMDIFEASVGNNPTLKDILRMNHTKPNSVEKEALFAYVCGAELSSDLKTLTVGERVHNFSNLPEEVQYYEQYKRSKSRKGLNPPNVEFRLLDSVCNSTEMQQVWLNQARNGGWHNLRMNLNNFVKYGVFNHTDMVKHVASVLSNKEEVVRSRAFPYQIMTSYLYATSAPHQVQEALQDAMEIATENVPEIEGQVHICIDTSGSMRGPITGTAFPRSVVTCLHVAGLFGSALLRRNRSANVVLFNTQVVNLNLNPRDTVLTNAAKLSQNATGGTDCASPLRRLNEQGATGDTVIFVSDCESWLDTPARAGVNNNTGMQVEWQKYKTRNPNAKLICIDIVPRPNTQVKEHQDVLCVGGFSDQVFRVIDGFIKSGNDKDYWVSQINQTSLEHRIPVQVENEDE